MAAYTKSYEESIGTKMNDLAVRLVVVSTIASYSPLNISETVRERLGFKIAPIGNGLWSRDR